MSKKLFISQLEKKYKIVYLHNPKHFFLNTLYIENYPNGRKLLCAYPRPHSKQFHHLALLKPLGGIGFSEKPNETKLMEASVERIKAKPFGGIFQD